MTVIISEWYNVSLDGCPCIFVGWKLFEHCVYWCSNIMMIIVVEFTINPCALQWIVAKNVLAPCRWVQHFYFDWTQGSSMISPQLLFLQFLFRTRRHTWQQSPKIWWSMIYFVAHCASNDHKLPLGTPSRSQRVILVRDMSNFSEILNRILFVSKP